MAASIASCKKEEKPEVTTPVPTIPAFRSDISYSAINDTIAYDALFVDEKQAKTVDLTEGNNHLNVFKALDAYAKLPNPSGSTTVLESSVLNNMFSNSGSPFTGTYAYLNGSSAQLRNKVASSMANPEATRIEMEIFFTRLATASESIADSAYQGHAGKLGTRLLDENGIEWCQVIAKSLMGAYQLDHIGNTLLNNARLEAANNNKLVEGKNYTELEHIWDEAYASLTLNKRIYQNLTSSSNGESMLGAYIQEYNPNFTALHSYFLKGRVAIVKNDLAEVKIQAQNIRKAMEIAIAKSAIAYMEKTKDVNTSSAAHALSEGLGFVYSLRFCTLKGANEQFSEDQLTLLGFYGDGFWGVTPSRLNEVIANIQTKFGL